MNRSLKELIKDHIETAYGGNQAAFARATGFKPQTVNTWLKGKTTLPHIDARRRLAKELGMSHLELLVVMGEISPDEAAIPDDLRTDAVRRLQPVIDQIQWDDAIFAIAEQQLRAIRNMQQGRDLGDR